MIACPNRTGVGAVEKLLVMERLGVGVPLLVIVQLIASPPLAVKVMGNALIDATLVPTVLPFVQTTVFE